LDIHVQFNEDLYERLYGIVVAVPYSS